MYISIKIMYITMRIMKKDYTVHEIEENKKG